MDLVKYYEIARVAEFIRVHCFTRVALQFPDYLLKDSRSVLMALRGAISSPVKLYVMADTTYGSCCVDEVGAAHVNAECIVHYGHTCLSPTSTLPALFVFGKDSIRAEICASSLLNYGMKSSKSILVLFGLEFAHAIPEIKEAITSRGRELSFEVVYADVLCSVMTPSETNVANTLSTGESLQQEKVRNYRIGGLSWSLPIERKMEDYLIFWIGSNNQAFANVVLTFNGCDIVRYDASEACLAFDLSEQKRILKRRYYLVEKVKEANMIGILVGTLGTAGYLQMIHQMRDLIEKSGKKSYTFVMGKPNPAKLANFPECDAFIHVSCPQTALLDSKDFLAPVITPFEAMIALARGRQWTGDYVMDFREVLDSVSSVTTSAEEEQEEEEARFSFIHGGYIEDLNLQDSSKSREDSCSELIAITGAKSGAEYFGRRGYNGLDIDSAGYSLPLGKFLVGRRDLERLWRGTCSGFVRPFGVSARS